MKNMMSQQTLIENAFAKQDLLATEVLSKKERVVPILKVARAGATTSLIKQAVESHKKVVIFEPTHKIGESTVHDAILYSKNKDARILQILKNTDVCKKLQIECEKKIRLKNMKWLLRPVDCEKCELFNDSSCELQRILNCSDWDVMVVTYQKLKALTLSKEYSKVSQALLQKLSTADVIIFDEYTSGLLGLTPTVELSDKKYESLLNVIFDGYDEWWEKVLQISFDSLEFGKKLDAGRCDKFCNSLSEEDLLQLNNNFTAMWNKVKRLTAKGIDTDFLQDMLQLVCCKELLVHKDRKQHITLKPIEPFEKELSFINAFADDFAMQGKLSILVDAHLPEFDLQKHFTSKVEPFLWGDPNNTNFNLAYFCDSRKISEEDLYHEKTRKYLQESINVICNLHKAAGRILVVCLNKAMAGEVENWQKQGAIPDVKVTWYRSVLTKGVQAEGYVQIMMGAPYIPLASYYHKVAQQAGVDKATAWNQAFRNSNMHAEFVNASSRVKDPLGVYQSYVYCLGITRFEVMQFLDLYGQLYESDEVKRPTIVTYAKTGIDPKMWVDMTKFFQRRSEIFDSEQSLPFILELTRVFTKTNGKVRLQQAFRTESSEAKEAFLKNTEFLMSIDIYIEKHGRGLVLVLNDRKPYTNTNRDFCRLETQVAVTNG
jgi:hypothetical protein